MVSCLGARRHNIDQWWPLTSGAIPLWSITTEMLCVEIITALVMIIQFQLQPCPLRVQCMSILITQGLGTLRGNIKSELSFLPFLDTDIAQVVDPFQMDDKDPFIIHIRQESCGCSGHAQKLHMIRQDVSLVIQKYSGLGTIGIMCKFLQWKMLSLNDF